ncbi:hypothetical protein ARC20_08360 [Stenotrophomonas panacihumi]|uniref:GGDEF domain-containing protein n=1 Tax=Stenotrophomonas panacihumi TaxID=676599 RepID=A0A0R0ARQ9_9GAMM|nr:hypothetical protein ARC20_08360 [Stenotrophomonas panacihumi]PTN54976.1 hypothetical protein C9J98_07150 [Stenotrophomonas panacihumi]
MRRRALVRWVGAAIVALLAFLLAIGGLFAPADAWLLRHLHADTYIYDSPWLAAALAAAFWLVRPRTARRGRLAGVAWAIGPLLLAAALALATHRGWPPLPTTVAILMVAVLRRIRLRRFPELEHLTALQRAADTALRSADTLPCSLVRLQLRGPQGRRLPLAEIVHTLKARARRGGDRVARGGGQDGFVLWLAHTDAAAALAVACDLRADLAPLLTRHALHCSMGIATQTAPGGHFERLWQQAAPPAA